MNHWGVQFLPFSPLVLALYKIKKWAVSKHKKLVMLVASWKSELEGRLFIALCVTAHSLPVMAYLGRQFFGNNFIKM